MGKIKDLVIDVDLSDELRELKTDMINEVRNPNAKRKVKTIDAYSKAFEFIHNIESKTGTIDYRKEILTFK